MLHQVGLGHLPCRRSTNYGAQSRINEQRVNVFIFSQFIKSNSHYLKKKYLPHKKASAIAAARFIYSSIFRYDYASLI